MENYHPMGGLFHQTIDRKFYGIYGAGSGSLCIGSERNPQRHSRVKKPLSAAFSARALADQETIVSQCVDRFMVQIEDVETKTTFGESFHSIEDGNLHFWSSLVEDYLYFITLAGNLRHFPLVLLAKGMVHKGKVDRYVTPMVGRLLDIDCPCIYIGVRRAALTSHTALQVERRWLKSKRAYRKFQDEIRDQLRTPLLTRRCESTLRVHKVLPRVSPGVPIDGHWVPARVSTEVYTSTWSVTHEEADFHCPEIFKPVLKLLP
ncbi:benzoate 4-monooxygenase cytochrome P450 [Microsporum canis CBS 113480]|uniref:Benzoate 4-monooxygenase cytochrome P450 n=1 Tax=Arthroderma otae (strain ATCC MYA-4605 / CBS 113480) TaxID=554155 RepID=C5FGF2_ARTOC|nr:benzoate 4-monooxygenase cytochrome P450 [Microsporum canis CBS 113480]EEQ29837.1 benzoate 4-monooxygenase cytochrome P450 [Microsporum canis CBS 113480]